MGAAVRTLLRWFRFDEETMKTSRINIALICAALTASFGCDDSSTEKVALPCDGACLAGQTCNEATNTCEGTPVEIECTYDTECAGDLVCENSHCVAVCTNNDDCRGNLVCRNDRCVPECQNNDECEGDLVCKNQVCKPECEKDTDCDGVWVCRSNRCEPECESAADCNEAAGEVCHADQCRVGCIEDGDCASNHCMDGACVDCLFDAHCVENTNGTLCVENNCVECDRNEDCGGTFVCVGNMCEPACTSDTQCAEKDSALPFCIDDAENGNLNAVCVACTDSTQCAGNKICVDNVCTFECTADLDCSGGQKCDQSDNHCYMCVKNGDCGSNQFCDEHVCSACEDGDYDCDGVPDEEDGCPYNPNVKDPVSDEPDYDCNYVTDKDGSRVFEIWHASDFERLSREIAAVNQPVVPEPCDPPEEGEEPTIGQCCDAAEYVNSCSSGKMLSCASDIVIETTCDYGCDEDHCASCLPLEDGDDYSAGSCCDDSFNAFCDEDKAQKCDNGIIVESVCDYGCDGTSCKLCNENSDKSNPVVGDCCDPMMYKPSCQADGQSKLECVNGVVVLNECNDCIAFGTEQVVCEPQYTAKLHVRLMNDINLADAAADGDIVEVPFDSLNVPWREYIPNEDGVPVEKIYTPGDADYKAFEIPDATCVMRWRSVDLENVHFDGQNHRIFFRNASGETCSLVDPLFDAVASSVVESLSLNYNMRGVVQSMFAKEIRNSSLTNVHFAGNINLENKPAMNEASESDYISGNKVTSNQYYSFGIMNSPSAESWTNDFRDIRFRGNITQNTTYAFGISTPNEDIPSGLYLGVAGFNGLFGMLSDSFVSDSSVTVDDYVLTNNRGFNGWAANVGNNSRILSPATKIAWIGANNTNNSTILLSPFADTINNSTIIGGISSRVDSVYAIKGKTISYLDFSYRINNLTSLGDFQIELNRMNGIHSYYALSRTWSNSKHTGNILAKRGSMVLYAHYYGVGDYLNNLSINGDVSIALNGDPEGRSLQGRGYFGVAYNPKESTIWGKLTIRTKALDLIEGTDNHYYGIASEGENFKLNDVDIVTGDLKYRKYYGLFNNPNNCSVMGTTTITTGNHQSSDSYTGIAFAIKKFSIGDITIKIGDISAPNDYYGIGQEISANGIMLNGKTSIEVGNMTEMGPTYGLANAIKRSVNNVSIKLGNVKQRDKEVNAYTHYFWGLASLISGGGSDVISNVTIDIGNIISPFYVSGLFHECKAGITTNNIKLTMGDISLDIGTQGTKNHGDFDGLCRDVSTTISNVSAKFGNIYIIAGYRGWALGSYMHSGGKFESVKVEIESMVLDGGRGGAVDEMEANSAIDGAAVLIRHLQTDASEVSAIKRTMANTSVKNFSYYADVYAKSIISSGFINNITNATLSLENIFSAARMNTYTGIDATTHKASDGIKTEHGPHLFNALPGSAITIEDTQLDTKKLNLAQTKNVYWLMRDSADYATELKFISLDGEVQFPAFAPDAVEFALQSGTTDIDPANTLSGCENIASCSKPTMWAPVSSMKKVVEPRGGTIYIPWIK